MPYQKGSPASRASTDGQQQRRSYGHNLTEEGGPAGLGPETPDPQEPKPRQASPPDSGSSQVSTLLLMSCCESECSSFCKTHFISTFRRPSLNMCKTSCEVYKDFFGDWHHYIIISLSVCIIRQHCCLVSFRKERTCVYLQRLRAKFLTAQPHSLL